MEFMKKIKDAFGKSIMPEEAKKLHNELVNLHTSLWSEEFRNDDIHHQQYRAAKEYSVLRQHYSKKEIEVALTAIDKSLMTKDSDYDFIGGDIPVFTSDLERHVLQYGGHEKYARDAAERKSTRAAVAFDEQGMPHSIQNEFGKKLEALAESIVEYRLAQGDPADEVSSVVREYAMLRMTHSQESISNSINMTIANGSGEILIEAEIRMQRLGGANSAVEYETAALSLRAETNNYDQAVDDYIVEQNGNRQDLEILKKTYESCRKSLHDTMQICLTKYGQDFVEENMKTRTHLETAYQDVGYVPGKGFIQSLDDGGYPTITKEVEESVQQLNAQEPSNEQQQHAITIQKAAQIAVSASKALEDAIISSEDLKPFRQDKEHAIKNFEQKAIGYVQQYGEKSFREVVSDALGPKSTLANQALRKLDLGHGLGI